MPRLTYVSQTAQAVNFEYVDMPLNTHVIFVDRFNKICGSATSPYGTGSSSLPTTGLKTGDYFLSARADADTEVARSIKFHIQAD